MTQHYTGNTVSVSRWCRFCHKHTQHRVDSHRVTNVCLECPSRAEEERTRQLAFDIESAVQKAAVQKVRELKKYYGVPLAAVDVPVGCCCSKYPCSHFHAIRTRDGDHYKFRPGTWEVNRA